MQFEHYDPKTSIGFYNHVSTHHEATLASGEQIRKFHPNAPMVISIDGNHFSDNISVANQLRANFVWNRKSLGYPQQPYGYKREGVLEWLNRLYCGFAMMDVTHVMMWEDDSFFFGPVDFDESWKCVGHNITHGNEIHPSLLQLIEDFSGKMPKTNFYGNGGCSIFAKEPLMEHYWEIHKWLDGNLDWIQYNFYPTIGWMDCLMTIVYMLCGCDYVVNPFLYNLDPHNPNEAAMDHDSMIDKFKDTKYNIIHNFKAYY